VAELLGMSPRSVRSVTWRLRRQIHRAELVQEVRRVLNATQQHSADEGPPHPKAASGVLYGLRAARQAAGLSILELATRAGIARETLSRLEHLHRATNLQTVQSLASALGVPVEALTRPPERA
jgi:DNA-binding XRE family transcriptional regulator